MTSSAQPFNELMTPPGFLEATSADTISFLKLATTQSSAT